jgi:iron complex transport system permease protein
MRVTPVRIATISLLLLGFLASVCLLSLGTGPAKLPPGAVLTELFGTPGTLDPMDRTILMRVRLPRVLLGALVGGTLAVGGVVFQALLRNPLAEPFILGVMGGSAFGAILGILCGWTFFPGVTGVAFVGGLLTIALVMGIAGRGTRLHTNTLLLSGVIVNAFFSAAIMFLLSVTRNEEIHNVLRWLMGDLSFSTSKELAILAPLVIIGFALIFAASRSLNLLVMGEETALHLGVQVEQLKKGLLVLVSLVVSAAVALSGIIGFVGLIIPHVLRLLVGPDHRVLLPASFLFGATFLVFCDTVARVATSQTELPVGVITALAGGPFFIYLLRRKRT